MRDGAARIPIGAAPAPGLRRQFIPAGLCRVIIVADDAAAVADAGDLPADWPQNWPAGGPTRAFIWL